MLCSTKLLATKTKSAKFISFNFDRQRDIFWVHEIAPNRWRYGVLFRTIARRVARIVCVSNAVASAVLALGVPPSCVTVIHNGLPPCDPLPRVSNGGTLQLGIVGQVGEWKGHEDLLHAIALLAEERHRINLKIFGSGTPDYVAALKKLIFDLSIEDRVEWCGFVDDQLEIFRNIDLCVQASRIDEAFGMSAVEAGAYGRPVIATSRGGFPETIEHGVTGFLVPSHDPEMIAAAIKHFLRTPSLLKKMGEAAHKRVQTEFALGKCVTRFISVIEEFQRSS